MAKAMFENRENIHKCNTDSILSTVKLDLEIGTNIGEWKIENQGKCYIKNGHEKVEWL